MWSLELFRTVDGHRLGELPLVAFSFALTVRDARMDGDPTGLSEDVATGLTFTHDMLERAGWIDRATEGWQARLADMFMPDKHGIMALFNGEPIVGGPIGNPVAFSHGRVVLSVDGLHQILARRYVVPETFRADRQLHWSGLTLGSIAKRAVEQVMSKPSGALPINLPEDQADIHERTYQGFNVANLAARDILEKLSDVENGPDIILRPKTDGNRFTWDLVTGTATDPWIGQDTVHDFEQGSTDVETITADLSTEYIAHRVYAVGGESDVATPARRYSTTVPDGWPLLEAVVSDTDIRYPDDGDDLTAEERTHLTDNANRLLDGIGKALLASSPVVQPRMRVRADGSTPLGRFWPGELAQVTVHESAPFTPGTYLWRVLAISGSVEGSVELVFDPVSLDRT